eukprot:TRINITY_DN4853_c0_g1_i1.p2 TRINITY_DN4853_c0_g1~~TRINITY_DN4853_c0_g1_i1.p2  ORF type:complete len:106 (+),score=35.01 TRINITY_DN4853_c0_g1_i1:84-401(+)
MGEALSRTWSNCSDPEGVANLVRQKRQWRAALEKYEEHFNSIEACLDQGDISTARENYEALKRFDAETDRRGLNPGDFRKHLNEHRDWPAVAARRKVVDDKMAAL